MTPCAHRSNDGRLRQVQSRSFDGTVTVDSEDSTKHLRTPLSATATSTRVQMFVEDESGQSDTWAVGISYSDGPMTVSIDHVSHERENGDERTATGISAGYKLAPGVDWKTSIISIEDDTWENAATKTTGSEGTDLRDRPRPRTSRPSPSSGLTGGPPPGGPLFFAPARPSILPDPTVPEPGARALLRRRDRFAGPAVPALRIRKIRPFAAAGRPQELWAIPA